ncbi:MAG: ABC transporter ATP-binding protein [Chryseolinea sp.]
MDNSVIKVENLSKRYRIGLKETKAKTLTRQVLDTIQTPLRNFKRLTSLGSFDKDDASIYWALKDINFQVNRGEVLGVIGRNGAGKSTLLKILSRITDPTAGSALLAGRVSSLLEVGTGFHPELTGRENVYMNATILGMRRREVDRKFDEIVDFAGVEKFIDTPVKFYSSGMKVRLGFAVAANLDPEILIIDEVLAVGDVQFQQKCMGKMDEVARQQGRTILFVSHSIPAIKTLCTKGLLLEAGRLSFFGPVSETVNRYFKTDDRATGAFQPGKFSSGERVVVKSVSIENQHGIMTETFHIGDDLKVNVCLHSEEEFESPNIGIVIKSDVSAVSVANTMFDGTRTRRFIKGENFLSCTFRGLPLLPQEYNLSIIIRDSSAKTPLTTSKEIGYFVIATRMRDIGIFSPMADLIAADSVSPFIPYAWDFGNGDVQSFNLLDKVKGHNFNHHLKKI